MDIWGRTLYPTLSKRPDFNPPRPDDDDKTKSSTGTSSVTGTPAHGKTKNRKTKSGASGKGSVPQTRDTWRDLRPSPHKRTSPPVKMQDVREQKQPQPASEVLKRYPDATQLAQRFLLLEQNAEAIGLKPRDQLSIDDGLTLKEYDTLRDRLAFLRADGATQDRGPVAMRRLPAVNASGGDQTPPTATPARKDGPEVRYVGGVKIRNDYSLKEVLDITSDALKSPFGSFIASSRDLVRKATDGAALSADEEQKIYQYAQIVESFLTLSRAGRVQQAAGAAVDTLNSAIAGEPQSPQTMKDNIGQVQGLGDTLTPAATGAGRIIRKPPVSAQPKATQASPPKEPLSIFDFPRLRIPLSMRSPVSGAQAAFKPPTRLPTGQVGYPLGPTRPPKLPAEGASGASAVKEGGPHEKPVASAAQAGGPHEKPVAGTSGVASGTTEQGMRGRSSSEPGRKPSETVTNCSPSTGCVPTGAAPITIEDAELNRIAGKGPISVNAPLGPDEDQRRVNAFDMRFLYYRSDRDTAGMPRARRLRNTSYEERRDVLTVGNGGDVTSYAADSKVFLGRQWGPHGARLADDINVIELSNGRDGVGALKLRFTDIPEGASVVVTGGAMNGCTMLFASDGHSLYAYHAGTSSLNANWHTARDGAHSIVKAHEAIGGRSTTPHKWQNNNLDLVEVGRQYPFSALIYSGRKLGNTGAVVGAGALAGAIASPEQALPNAYLNVKRHEYGPRSNRWHMMTFNYYEQNPQQPSVGTALAVVSRNMDGSVTLRVLAERGNLDRSASIGSRGDPISYRYTTVDSDSATCWLDKA